MFEKDTDAYARDRDAEIVEIAKEAGVEVIIKLGRTLYDPDELVRANGGKPTMSITQVQNVRTNTFNLKALLTFCSSSVQAAKKLPPIPQSIPAPTSLPPPGDLALPFTQTKPEQTPDLNSPHRASTETSYANIAGPNNDFAPPTMSELGLPLATTPHRGGETLALTQLDRIIADEDYTATFSKPETAPTAFSPQSTTLLSPHMHFGSLSPRLFYHRAAAILAAYDRAKKPHATIPTNLLGQLLFREMYFGAQAALGHAFGQSRNNPSCRFIPWHLPSTISPTTGLALAAYDPEDSPPEAETWLRRWASGTTGFPWIDALMRQLRAEGWIHHLGRHAVACFLTRGGCYVDWERGAAVFEALLLDHETACNAGNWQWLACAAFYSQFHRCYSPVAFPKRWDKQGAFVRNYVPELAQFGDGCIYEPWKANRAEQRRWGCWVKGDGSNNGGQEGGGDEMKVYPAPMFDFDERRRVCMEGMKVAYKIGLYGNDARLKDGSWRNLFPARAEGVVPTRSGTETITLAEERNRNGNGKDGDAGTDADEREAAELGGETRGGDRVAAAAAHAGDGNGRRTPASRASAAAKSGGTALKGGDIAAAGPAKRKRQGTLDGDFGVKPGRRR